MRQSDGDRRVETDWFPLRPHPCSRRSIISNSRYQLFYRLRQREERESWKILEEHEVEEVYSFFHISFHMTILSIFVFYKSCCLLSSMNGLHLKS
ncbi:unnamed protein product [Brassica napus]|nr:unnamed protein product [Brassica napus]